MTNSNKVVISKPKQQFMMHDKKANNFKVPDVSKMQEVIIDSRTKIYIPVGADPGEARSRYLSRIEAKNQSHMASRKTVATE